MDAVKFLREYRRMCTARKRCLDCPMRDIKRYTCSLSTYNNDDELNKMIEIVKNWSRENPEIIGKKYIIEIDEVDRDRGRKQYHIKGAQGFWISDGNLTDLEEYKEHDACKGCKYEDMTGKEEPCVYCRHAWGDEWVAKR